ncbi:Uncharacterised protein [Mycobacteroides abscessus]|nr:Uncharacterised protein [Mycobacteroides abscessus]
MVLRLRRRPEEQLRVLVLRVEDDLVRRPALDDVPAEHHEDLVAEVPRRREVVRDVEDAEVLLALQARQQVEHPEPDRHVEHRHGLVRDEEPGAGGERAGDRDALALASGHLVRTLLRERPRGREVHAREELVDGRVELGGRLRAPVDPQRPLQVVTDRVERVERRERVLEHHLDVVPVLGQATATPGGRDAVEQDVAGRRRLELRDHPRDGRLPGTRLTDDGDRLARLERERHVVHRAQPRPLPPVADDEVLGEVPDLERAHQATPPVLSAVSSPDRTNPPRSPVRLGNDPSRRRVYSCAGAL